MKKIVGILGMAAVLASAAFAADPAANFVMADFTGSAEFGWEADFSKKDAEMGMFNKNGATLKFGFVSAGDKTTTGDGVWGELKIAADATSVTNGAIKLGDKKYETGNVELKSETANKGPLVTRDGADKDAFLNLPGLFPKAAVKTAKIHFVDGDFALALNILPPSLEYGAYAAPKATGSTLEAAKIGDMTDMNAGFGVEVALDKVFAMNVKFMDNAKAHEKKYGLALDASLKAVENLDLTVAGTFNFGTKYTGFAANAGYKLAIDDTLYVKPGVAFTMGKKEADKEAKNSLEAGVLFGWGKADQEPGFAYVPNKTTEGVSVAFGMDMKDKMNLTVGLYDQSLMSLLGDDFGTLKTGVLYTMANDKVADKKVTTSLVAAGVRYAVTFSPVYVELGADFKMDMKTDTDNLTAYAISAKLGSKEIIDNTDVYVLYNIGNSQAFDTVDTKKIVDTKTNNLTIGTKISF